MLATHLDRIYLRSMIFPLTLRCATAALLLAAAPILGQPSSQRKIHRLDGTTISVQDAEAFALKTLTDQKVTGAQLAIITNGKLSWSYATGLRHKNPDLPMTTDTNIWAASITKSVFATYVMHLVETESFQLDTPLAKQLPQSLDTYKPYRLSASELVKDPRWATVTPRMLLSHSSGLYNFAFIEPDEKMHLHFTPGTEFHYSGEGINLVQFLIEQQKHTPIEDLMQAAIFSPLGMTHTGLIYRKEFDTNLANRFDQNEAFHAETHRFPARAAGSMATSVNDLVRFTTALLDGKIIKAKTMHQMLTPVFAIRTEHQFPIAADETRSAEAASVGLAYGVGWGLLTQTKFGPAFFKEGHGDGAQNYMVCFQRSRSCMMLLTNSDNGELAFRSLLEHLLADTVTPWEWEGYTPAYIEASRKTQ